MTRASRVAVILGIAVVAAVLPATPALANGKLLRGIDDEYYRYEDPGLRDTWLERTYDAGARIVRIPVFWRNVAPTKPVNPTDPADPAYHFEQVDEVISDAQAHGLSVLIQVVFAPDWAEGENRAFGAEPGTWKPDPGAYGSFAEAVGRRYSGQFSGPSGPLPQVRYFEAWNETNLSRFLTPQWEGNRPTAAIHYRLLLNAFYDGIKRAQPAAQVIAGATAPYGDPGHPELGRMRPLRFLRELLCLSRKDTIKCPTKPKLDILSHHPLSTSGGPLVNAIHRDDAATADFDEVVELLRRAERAGTVLPRGKGRDAWASELWWLSDPPGGPSTVPLDIHARWVELSFYELWKQGASAAIYYQIVDKPLLATNAEQSSGLYFGDEQPKPALQAFRFPFVTERRGQGRLRVWTIPPASGTLTIEVEQGGQWRAVHSMSVKQGIPKTATIRAGGKQDTRGVIGGQASLPW